MTKKNEVVIKNHRSNYPNPITLVEGQRVRIGKLYDGPENWQNWRYCYTLDEQQLEGWVPEQIIEKDGEIGILTTTYTAKELNVDAGDRVVFMHELNGWSWCELESTGECGWIPNECLSTER
ncbi:ligand-binding protein SH3 [Brevibacillus sp. M2.1A]|uniref:SH3 domain-containing protein n=1 Tax=Brevibacillus TaxID=55080 RepID=UPI00156BB33A|nr:MULTISPECIES: SH3 domain-containing protein [Brevibacillus]MBY0087533.1 ligand-binding protein SH3 [Brevibacillus brevis]MCC8436582.1 ligand-binding protein SH3 [Brevibacillus sp. M2.1A]MCE0448574.1 ligand-binding protein SH3 [Brevibacillus sp. AF8]